MISLPPVILIQLQDDLGTNLVVLSIIAGTVLMSGISWKILVPSISLVVILGGGLIGLAAFYPDLLLDSGIFQPYQLERINSWLDPFGDTQGNSYQLAQSIMAVGSGQLAGKGVGVS